MNFKIGIFGFLAAVLLIVSCSKENIDMTTEEEEEVNAEVVLCTMEVAIALDTIGFETVFTAVVDGGTAPFNFKYLVVFFKYLNIRWNVPDINIHSFGSCICILLTFTHFARSSNRPHS